MPIYEYFCKQCQHQFESFQKISEPPIAPCPQCGSTADRIISQTHFSLKGGGWYKDGYASTGSGSKQTTTTSTKPVPTEKKDAGKKDTGKGSTTAS